MSFLLAAAGFDRRRTAQMSEGSFVAKSLGIVAGCDQQRGGGVGPDAERGDQPRRGLFDQGLEDGVDLGDLLFEGDGPPGQHPQGELVSETMSRLVPGR